MTAEEAIRDGLTDTATSLGSGAVASGATYLGGQALAPAGITATVGAAAAPIVVGGVVMYGGYTVYRLYRAAQPEPLYPTELAFAH